MESTALQSLIESILFVSEKSVSVARVHELLGETSPGNEAIAEAFQAIQAKYQDPSFGIFLRDTHGGFQYVTKPENAEIIRKFQESKPFRLGRSALETLAILAYRGPVTRAEIDEIRGIDSSHLLRTLIERGLAKMAGKADAPGRPVQYATTEKFLETVGVSSLNQLPPLSELEELQGSTEDPMQKLVDGLDRFMEETPNPEETPLDENLTAIQDLIETADKAPKEIYASETHAEVAAENQRALEAFLESHPPLRRRKSKAAAAAEAPVEAAAEPTPEVTV